MSDQNQPQNLNPFAPIQPTVSVNPSAFDGTMAKFQDSGSSQIQTRVTMDLSRDDLAAIATTRVEQKIREKVSDYNAQLKILQRQLEAVVIDRNKILENFTADQYAQSTPLTTLESNLRTFFNNSPNALTISFGTATYSPSTRRMSGTVSFSSPLNRTLSLSFDFVTLASTQYLQCLESEETLTRQINELKAQIMQTRTALNNIDSIERQARATMAGRIAEQDPVGQKILAALNEQGDIDRIIASLTT